MPLKRRVNNMFESFVGFPTPAYVLLVHVEKAIYHGEV